MQQQSQQETAATDLPAQDAQPRRPRYGRNFARWLAASVVYYLATIVAVFWGLPADWKNLGYYFLYMSISNGLVPLAVNPPTVAAGALYAPALVALVGAAATCWANLSEYVILGPIFAHRRADSVKRTRIYRSLLRLFLRHPPLCIVIASFLPLPVDVIRFTAIASAYPVSRFLIFDFFGRFGRYFVLATLGDVFQDSTEVLTAIIVLLLILPPLVPWLRSRKSRARGKHEPEENPQPGSAVAEPGGLD